MGLLTLLSRVPWRLTGGVGGNWPRTWGGLGPAALTCCFLPWLGTWLFMGMRSGVLPVLQGCWVLR